MPSHFSERGNLVCRAIIFGWILLQLLLLCGHDFVKSSIEMHMFVWNLFR